MTTPLETPRPRVLGVVALITTRAVFSLILGGLLIRQMSQHPADFPAWTSPYLVVLFGIIAAELVGAVLIALYRRLGLIIGAVMVGVEAAHILILALFFQVSPTGLDVVILLIIGAYLARYLSVAALRSAFR